MTEDKDKRHRGTIEKRIRQLVEVFNENGIKTFFSCHGHLRDRNPYVVFTADPEIAYRIWEALCTTEWREKIGLLWTVRPLFWDIDIPGFVLEGKPIGGGFLAFRKKLEQDAHKLRYLVEIAKNIEDKHNDSTCCYNEIKSSVNPAPTWIFGPAESTPVRIGSDRMSASITGDSLFHKWVSFYQDKVFRSRWFTLAPLSSYFDLKGFANQLTQLYYEGAI